MSTLESEKPIHKQTLERRMYPDQVIQDSITNIECELLLLINDLREEEKEK
jgi:hypothetical protein